LSACILEISSIREKIEKICIQKNLFYKKHNILEENTIENLTLLWQFFQNIKNAQSFFPLQKELQYTQIPEIKVIFVKNKK
jgi:hypothetical protein